MDKPPEAGHRSVPHTADMRLEAWAPTRERCITEAIMAMVHSFAEPAGAPKPAVAEFRVESGPDDDMLVAALDEVIYRMDTEGELPVDAQVIPAGDGGLLVRARMAATSRFRLIGAVPKAVSWHDLRFERGEAGWSCVVTLDV
jgi:SHS2 domain-containing protein